MVEEGYEINGVIHGKVKWFWPHNAIRGRQNPRYPASSKAIRPMPVAMGA